MVCTGLADFDEIWQCDAYWHPSADRPLKFQIFKIQDGGSRHRENKKL